MRRHDRRKTFDPVDLRLKDRLFDEGLVNDYRPLFPVPDDRFFLSKDALEGRTDLRGAVRCMARKTALHGEQFRTGRVA